MTVGFWAGWLVDRAGIGHTNRRGTGDGGGPRVAWDCLVSYPEAVGQKEPASPWLASSPPSALHANIFSLEKLSPSLSGTVTPRLLSDSPPCAFTRHLHVLISGLGPCAVGCQISTAQASVCAQGSIQMCRLEG